ncbi:uncharacterized protein LOC117114431 [Anneissia japonica]|uniref:uncharacterized protein LOC117114431 n=1 Tax=Anneissia japonica TaxID=1529436 RepID=UPI00142597DA|nr:uncharacterized protein LOC117114431 [Anneissia japonica]
MINRNFSDEQDLSNWDLDVNGVFLLQMANDVNELFNFTADLIRLNEEAVEEQLDIKFYKVELFDFLNDLHEEEEDNDTDTVITYTLHVNRLYLKFRDMDV